MPSPDLESLDFDVILAAGRQLLRRIARRRPELVGRLAGPLLLKRAARWLRERDRSLRFLYRHGRSEVSRGFWTTRSLDGGPTHWVLDRGLTTCTELAACGVPVEDDSGFPPGEHAVTCPECLRLIAQVDAAAAAADPGDRAA